MKSMAAAEVVVAEEVAVVEEEVGEDDLVMKGVGMCSAAWMAAPVIQE